MKQLTYVGPGSMEFRDVSEPVLHSGDDALVRPIAVATCDLDSALVRGLTPWSGPLPLGHEGVAEVIEVGGSVVGVGVGDRVCLPYQVSCGACQRCIRGLTANCTGHGGLSSGPQFYGFSPTAREWGGFFSDVVRVPFADHMLLPLPLGVRPETAASLSDNIVDGWRTVAGPLSDRPGASVLIVGGSGAIGLYAVGFARVLGAERITYVDRAADRLEKAEALGADLITVKGAWPDQLDAHEITVDANSTPQGVRLALRSTAPGGFCTVTGMHFKPLELNLYEFYLADVTVKIGLIQASADMPAVLAAIASGGFDPSPVTDEVLPWDDALARLPGVRSKLIFLRD